MSESSTPKRTQAVEYLELNLPGGDFGDEWFFNLCQINEDLTIERNSDGKIVVTPLNGSKIGVARFKLSTAIGSWNSLKNSGIGFSSTGFRLPNGAIWGVAVAWTTSERWNSLSENQKEKFAPLCPDFVAEILPNRNLLAHFYSKIEEFLDNGTHLGWLIDPFKRVTYVYRPKVEVEIVPFDQPLFGGQVMPGLQVKMADWIKS